MCRCHHHCSSQPCAAWQLPQPPVACPENTIHACQNRQTLLECLVCATSLLGSNTLICVTCDASDMPDQLNNRVCVRPNVHEQQQGWVRSLGVWHWQANMVDHTNRPASQGVIWPHKQDILITVMASRHIHNSHGIQPIYSSANQLQYRLSKLRSETNTSRVTKVLRPAQCITELKHIFAAPKASGTCQY